MKVDDLLDACKSGDETRVRELLAATPSLAGLSAESGETPLVAALYRGHTRIVDLLIQAGAPLDLFAAAALGRGDLVERLVAEDSGSIARLSYDGWTALHLAAFFGHTATVETLLRLGADINARSTNTVGNTPLHAAVAGGRVDAALALVDAGATIDARDGGGHTPLHIAAEGGYVPIVESLLRHGADPHVVAAEDRTPLARAAAKNHVAVIDLINVNE
jgi:ankyrin repeat protein